MSAVTNTSSSAISNAVNSEIGGTTLGKDDFMLLLVTQFQYQDPLNPMEDKEFIAQLAQFSSLEQMMNMNESMESLTEATRNQELINATSYIGKAVDMVGDTLSKNTDTATGDVTVTVAHVTLGDNIVGGKVNVYDLSTGREVQTIEMPALTAGQQHEIAWDGTIYGGEMAADGVYRLLPEFKLASGDTLLDYAMVVDGKVNGVINENGVPYLQLEDGRVTPLSGVLRVSEPNIVATATPDSDSGDGTNVDSNNGDSGDNTNGGSSTGGTDGADGDSTDTGTGDTTTGDPDSGSTNTGTDTGTGTEAGTGGGTDTGTTDTTTP